MRTNIQTILQAFIWLTLFTPLATWGAIFTAQTTTEIESALAVAATNGENDTINISSGAYNLTASLIYQSNEDHSLTIQSSGGNVELNAQAQNYRGLYIRTNTENAHITLKDITISNGRVANPEVGGGAYIYVASADITIENSSFINNTESQLSLPANGAGLFIKSGGGGILLNGNIFRGNQVNGTGGGLYINSGINSNATLVNNIFDKNEANIAGGGAYISVITGTLTLTNNTFNYNVTGDGNGGGGLYARFFYNHTIANIFNNIFWGNTAQNNIGEDLYVMADGNKNNTEAAVFIANNNYSSLGSDVINNHFVLANNINQDPLFTADLHLASGSPSINAGTDIAPSLPAVDIGGALRGSQPDIGAYEFQDPNDSDGDGLPDSYENQYAFLNSQVSSDASQDQDGDGLTNFQEYQAGSSPTNTDTDGDGLSDMYELANNLDPTKEDSDRDGLSDSYELDNGLDPTDGVCLPRICGNGGSAGWRLALAMLQVQQGPSPQ